MSGARFELDLTAACVRCGAEPDEFEGRLLVEGEHTMVVEAPKPCSCGERRFKVTFGIDGQEDAAGPEDEGRPPDRDAG